jgi:hypothetical protein
MLEIFSRIYELNIHNSQIRKKLQKCFSGEGEANERGMYGTNTSGENLLTDDNMAI